MPKKYCYFFSFLFFSVFTFGQNGKEKIIIGKIIVDSNEVQGVHVLNLNTEKAVISDVNGMFQITVRLNDLLTFSAVNLDYWRKSIDENDLKKDFILIKMTQKTTKLDEVVVTEYTKINAQALGIINYTPKKYTPAERRLRTAEKFKWYSPLLIPVGGMSVDGLINQLSGRTDMLKKELEVERKEKKMEKLEYLYDNAFFINVLKIPTEYVGAFKYYAIENEKLVLVLNEKNRLKASFLIGEIAQEYLIILKENEK